MTALATDHTDALALDAARAENHRLRELIAACERYETGLHARIIELVQANQRLVHERDALRDQVGSVVRVARTEPALTVYCDTPKCTTPPLTSKALPPEDAIPQWIRGMGWTVDGEGHWCPRCKAPPAPLPVARVVRR